MDHSFFDQLQQGITSIDQKVTRLKNLAANNFVESETGELTDDEYEKVCRFEQDIKSMHQQLTQLKCHVSNQKIDLDSVENKLQDFMAQLNRFVIQNELVKYGYVPWTSSRPVDADREADDRPAVIAPSLRNGCHPMPEMNGKVLTNGNHVEFTETIDSGSGSHSPAKTVQQPVTMKTAPKQRLDTMTPKTAIFSQYDDNKEKIELIRSRHKLGLNFQPSPRPAAARMKRFTILPPAAMAESFAAPKAAAAPKIPDPIIERKSKPQENPYAGEATTRFNLPVLMQSYNTSQTAGTPVMNNTGYDSTINEQETVEFTPGLTTKRPVAVKRCKPSMLVMDEKTKSVTKDLKNLSFVATPTQPIPSRMLIESVKSNMSHGKMKLVGDKIVPSTPQMPVSNIESKLLDFVLRNKK